MIIPINEQYRIASDAYQWAVQKRRDRNNKEDWESQTYHPSVDAAVRSLGAVLAIRQKINYDFPGLESTNAFINPLIDELMEKHPIVRQHFFSGTGGALQFQDSQIAEYVLAHMKARRQLVLPVHDSFVVQDKYIAHLYATMKEAYRMLGIDSIPEAKLKEGASTDLNQPSFKELRKLITQEREMNEKELGGIYKLGDLIEKTRNFP